MQNVFKMDGYTLHIIPSKKFKDITIHINFKAPLTKENAALRAVLAFVMTSATKTYPTNATLSSYLDDLYGASLSANVSSKGQAHMISLRTTAVNQEFLPVNDDLLEKQIGLLNEVLFAPLVSHQSFDEDLVEIKKKEIIARIQQALDDKMNYSIDQLYHYMGMNTPLDISAIGEKEDVERITGEDIYQAYLSMLKNDDKYVYIVGDIDEHVVESFKNNLHFEAHSQEYPVIYDFNSKKDEVLEIIEKQEITQAKLNLGYTLETDFKDDDTEAMSIFVDMLGGYSQSRLFLNVREKNSLCYYISASYDPFNSIMLIASGIETKHYQKARALIDEEIAHFKNGSFSDDELAMAKQMVVSSLTKAYDSSSYLISLAYNRDLVHKQQSIQDYINKINAVTREDIIRCAQQIKLDTVYLLTRKDPYGKDILSDN